MENARHRVAINREPAPDDDAQIVDKLTAKQDHFARVWAETGNQAAAYRAAYNVGDRTLPNTIWAMASRLAALPHVQARYKQLYDNSLLQSIMSIRELYQITADIVRANPNDIVTVQAVCCRHCYGTDYGYQWRDESEYIAECVKALDLKLEPPSDSGGYGYFATLEPNQLCTHCFGAGLRSVRIADTNKLTGPARRLYAGAEQDRFGCIKVKLRDQDKAADLLARMNGAIPELGKEAPPRAENIAATMTDETASRAYLQLMD